MGLDSIMITADTSGDRLYIEFSLEGKCIAKNGITGENRETHQAIRWVYCEELVGANGSASSYSCS